MMRIATTLLLGCLSNTVATQLNVLVPPKGWNSWDCFQGDLNGTCAHLLVIEVIDPNLIGIRPFFFPSVSIFADCCTPPACNGGGCVGNVAETGATAIAETMVKYLLPAG